MSKPSKIFSLRRLYATAFIAVGLVTSPLTQAQEMRPATVLYKLSENASADQLKSLNALLHSQGLLEERIIPGMQLHIAKFDSSGRELAIAKILQASGYVKFAEPDFAFKPVLEPNDDEYPNQWHHAAINSPQAWDKTTGNYDIPVAVCDTGVDTDHPDLINNLTFPGFDAHIGFDSNGNVISTDVEDAHGHGTGTIGTLGAVGNNLSGVAGVNWDASIIPVRIAISDTNSSAYISSMVTCMQYAIQRGAKVVNISYGGISSSSINDAAITLRNNGGLLFMSAGNDYNEHPEYPDYVSLVGVGATDSSNIRASFSSYGDYVDIVAPGTSIRTTYLNGGYTYYSGTSFSSPMTAGVAALMLAANPNLTPDEIENGLFSTATDLGTPGEDILYGNGLVNAQAAVDYALNLGNYQPPFVEIVTDSSSVPFGETINFNAGNSYDPDGSITNYHWDFGDGSSASGFATSHLYQQSGIYQVTLTATDNDNLSTSTTSSVEVTNQLPVAIIDSMPTNYNLGEQILFNGANSYDPDSNGSITAYLWEFGDGQTSSEPSPSHSYAIGGTYNIRLTVTDNAQASNSANIEIEIIDPSQLLAPANFSIQVDQQTVTLSWDDNNSSEDGYILERATKVRGKYQFETLTTLPADSSGYIDDQVPLGSYQYRIAAFNSENQVYSEVLAVKVDTVAGEPAPQPGTLLAPTNLSASLNGNSATLSWTDNSDSEQGFYIERSEKVKGQLNFQRISQVASEVTSYSDPQALPSGTFYYRVQAFKDSDTSDYSNSVSIRVR